VRWSPFFRLLEVGLFWEQSAPFFRMGGLAVYDESFFFVSGGRLPLSSPVKLVRSERSLPSLQDSDALLALRVARIEPAPRRGASPFILFPRDRFPPSLPGLFPRRGFFSFVSEKEILFARRSLNYIVSSPCFSYPPYPGGGGPSSQNFRFEAPVSLLLRGRPGSFTEDFLHLRRDSQGKDTERTLSLSASTASPLPADRG